MRLLFRKPKKKSVTVFLGFLIVWVSLIVIKLSYGLNVAPPTETPNKVDKVKKWELKAFITSAYYYPTSKSLGNNALALVMNINLVKPPRKESDPPYPPDPAELVILAKNATLSVVVRATHVRVAHHEVCHVVPIFATAQLLPNVKSISMMGDDGEIEIPFQIPSYSKLDVVVCTSPLFVSEQWQNFLFAVHVYRKFGAHMNLYLISCVTSFYKLMKEYEREGYMKIQPWVKVEFPGVSRSIIDPFNHIEFRNQAAAQTDCLLQYKESARFVTFLDLDDVLIPKLAPTYAKEFQMIMAGKGRLAYMTYHKENYVATTTRYSSKFSLKNMFSSLECRHTRETGKIVLDPRNLNYTWIHFPPTMPDGFDKYDVTENVITHLKTITWTDDQEEFSQRVIEPPYFDNSSAKIISKRAILEIEEDLQRMISKPRIHKIFKSLPSSHYFTDLVVKCYNNRYYRYHYSGRISEIICPGPHLCGFHQHPKIKCTHVAATHKKMKTINPITYYYATDPHFTEDIGCYSH